MNSVPPESTSWETTPSESRVPPRLGAGSNAGSTVPSGSTCARLPREKPPTRANDPPMNQPPDPSATTARTFPPAPDTAGIAETGAPVAVDQPASGLLAGPIALIAPPTTSAPPDSARARPVPSRNRPGPGAELSSADASPTTAQDIAVDTTTNATLSRIVPRQHRSGNLRQPAAPSRMFVAWPQVIRRPKRSVRLSARSPQTLKPDARQASVLDSPARSPTIFRRRSPLDETVPERSRGSGPPRVERLPGAGRRVPWEGVTAVSQTAGRHPRPVSGHCQGVDQR